MNQIGYLTELFGNKSFAKLIEFFLSNSKQEFSQVRIKEKTKLSKATLTKWLGKLEKEEFIRVRKEGVSKLYHLEESNIIVKYIKIINSIMRLKELKNLKDKRNIRIFLYGSAARGEDSEKSDIDLLIIGKVRKEELIRDVNKLEDKLNKRIKIEIFTPLEWVELNKKDRAFYERVEKDKIEL